MPLGELAGSLLARRQLASCRICGRVWANCEWRIGRIGRASRASRARIWASLSGPKASPKASPKEAKATLGSQRIYARKLCKINISITVIVPPPVAHCQSSGATPQLQCAANGRLVLVGRTQTPPSNLPTPPSGPKHWPSFSFGATSGCGKRAFAKLLAKFLLCSCRRECNETTSWPLSAV